LPELLSAISKLYRDSGITESERSEDIPATLGDIGQNVVGTTGTIAEKLKATTASDLALAAAARMIFGEGQESFTRRKLPRQVDSFKVEFPAFLSAYTVGGNLPNASCGRWSLYSIIQRPVISRTSSRLRKRYRSNTSFR